MMTFSFVSLRNHSYLFQDHIEVVRDWKLRSMMLFELYITHQPRPRLMDIRYEIAK